MKFECNNCESLTDEKDIVMVYEDKSLVPYCRECWNIMNCKNPKEK